MDFVRMAPGAQKLMARATEQSTGLGHHYLGVEHLFLLLHESSEAPLTHALESQKIDVERLDRIVLESVATIENRPWGTEVVFTPRCREVLRIASQVAAQRNSHYVHEQDILEAMFREGRSVPILALRALNVNPADVCSALQHRAAHPKDSSTPLLDQYGRDLTAQAGLGQFSPVIGRDHEMDFLSQVLLRKNKNNPVLVGDAGVGKTAVVEGFASRLISDECPEPLRGSRIVELATASLVAGTKYRGEFEDRLLKIVKEASSTPGLILFLDEVHTLVGAGSAGGEALDASNILKPVLARGEMRCIGATTVAEYRRFIEKDAALDRRFEPVMVEEPTRGEAREILEGLKASLETHHELQIASEAVDAAVDLTIRYLPQRRLPDKAIDALDQSCARVRLRSYGKKPPAETGPVTAEEIARTVSQWTGVPLERIGGEEAKHLLGLEDELRAAVVGQDHAVRAVSRAILTSKAGLSSPDRPSAVFLFLGPTGVGKTELAKALARFQLGDEKKLIRFDMSEYSEAHSVAKLIGAPPGYVGHEQEGLLISAVRTHPHCVVLFDEMEKAHPQVFDLFLQIFDDGRLSGAHGVTADFTNATIILTSNIRPRMQEKQKPTVGFVSEDPTPAETIEAREYLMQVLRPELVNRIDEVVLFQPLGKVALRKIIDRYVHEIVQLAESRELGLELDDAVYDHLIDQAASGLYGARELRRVVDRQLRQALAEQMLRRGDSAGAVRVSLADGGLHFGWS